MRHKIARAGAILVAALITIGLLAACARPAVEPTVEPTVAPSAAQPTADIGPTAASVPADSPNANLPPDIAAARDTLERFLNALALGDYATAASLYGGDYSILQGYNPDIAPADGPGLLEGACTANGFVCLKPASIHLVGDHGNQLTFDVSFQQADGSIFVFTPPPGAAGEPRSSFPLRVVTGGAGPLVIDLPPYVS